MIGENETLKSEIKNLKEQLNNHPSLNNTESKLYIKPIKEEISKLIELNHEHHKRVLHLIIASIEEQKKMTY